MILPPIIFVLLKFFGFLSMSWETILSIITGYSIICLLLSGEATLRQDVENKIVELENKVQHLEWQISGLKSKETSYDEYDD